MRVAAFPVNAVLTRQSDLPQLEHNFSIASITRLFPVPPSPPRKKRSWSINSSLRSSPSRYDNDSEFFHRVNKAFPIVLTA
ncbi:hypothetical protein PHMEG_00037808 [Phytophthora megakarya]|uniref:Uncharacterized protein n=1 Tax=Phytophthora megakarya TaxID=4795 RepID=A0A225ULD5_9STRA|nr:hypothetical protein PHMEG_00037808 [Phytophthora megakarya]